ncbi:hypothetical protein [Endobacterium cereale]|uniref:hypothetical protein n=1 Tax=Endobacterium cereale TaxID=2663029 RepID=UPI002B45960B|nr:hypothetical protein [Endobacterium cereale]MEB2843789.1 hypothetical protein [Endobacterium cereale]
MRPQLYYWETFTTAKRDQIYTTILMERLDHTERCLNVFAAITGSAAIAGWIIWQHIPYVWGGIIAASQLYTAIKAHLPFGTRLKAYASLGPEMESLALTAERDWFKVSRGDLTEDEIIELATKLKRTKVDATNRHMKGVIAPEKQKLIVLADEKATAYMASFMEV